MRKTRKSSRSPSLKTSNGSGDKYYSAFFDKNPIPMCIIDPHDLRFLAVNRAVVDCYQYTPDEFSRLDLRGIIKEDEGDDFIKHLKKGAASRPLRSKHKRKDGEIIEVEVLIQDLHTNGKRAQLLVLNNVTEQMRAQRAILASEERFSRAFYSSPVAMCISSLDDGVLIEANEEFAKITGYTQPELRGRSLLDLAIWPQEEHRKNFIKRSLKGRENRRIEGHFRTRDGELRECLLSAEIIGLTDCAGLLLMMDDVTEAKRNQEKIRSYQEELRSMASQLAVAEEFERRRIAAQLHDLVGQNLAMMKIRLGAVQASTQSKKVKNELQNLRKLLEETLISARTLSFELSPPVLYEVGFEAAVEWLAERIETDHGIRVKLIDDRRPKSLPDPLKVVLFTAVRELFVNIVKHSKAKNAVVEIGTYRNRLVISVEDDGIGFDVSCLNVTERKLRGFGLFSVKERITHMGGQVQIHSKKGAGTTVVLTSPLKA